MKIRLAVLEKDTSYLNKFFKFFTMKYSDTLEIYSFTDYKIAIDKINTSKIDVLIANSEFEIDVSQLPKRCSFAYIIENKDIEMLRGQKAICKFQNIDVIYKQILEVYAERSETISQIKINNNGSRDAKIIIFSSPVGGCGNSTLSAACAVGLSKKKKRVMYLNIEMFSSVDFIFHAEGKSGLSDIIYALKSKKSNLSLKIESCVKQDPSGVFFFSQAEVPLDIAELKSDDIVLLIKELKGLGAYDYIIVDMDFNLDKKSIDIFKQAQSIIMTSDGTSISNSKIINAYNVLDILESKSDISLTSRLGLIYNKFNNMTSKVIEDVGMNINNIGGIIRYDQANINQIIEIISSHPLIEKFL